MIFIALDPTKLKKSPSSSVLYSPEIYLDHKVRKVIKDKNQCSIMIKLSRRSIIEQSWSKHCQVFCFSVWSANYFSGSYKYTLHKEKQIQTFYVDDAWSVTKRMHAHLNWKFSKVACEKWSVYPSETNVSSSSIWKGLFQNLSNYFKINIREKRFNSRYLHIQKNCSTPITNLFPKQHILPCHLVYKWLAKNFKVESWKLKC